jgi:hypothetical protein
MNVGYCSWHKDYARNTSICSAARRQHPGHRVVAYAEAQPFCAHSLPGCGRGSADCNPIEWPVAACLLRVF